MRHQTVRWDGARRFLPAATHGSQFVAYAAVVAAPALYGIATARLLGPNDRGVLITVLSAATFAGLLGTRGSASEYRRLITSGASPHLRREFIVTILSGAVIGGFLAVLILRSYHVETGLPIALLVVVLSALMAATILIRELLFGLRRMIVHNWLISAGFLVQLPLLYLLYETNSLGVVTALTLYVAFSGLVLMLLSVVWISVKSKNTAQSSPFKSGVSRAARLSLVPLLAHLYFSNGDRLVLSLVSSPDQVAFYSVAWTLALLPGMGVMAALPSLQDAAIHGVKASRRRMLVVALITVVSLLLVVLFAPSITNTIFGSDYAPSVDATRLMSLGALPYLMMTVVLTLMIGAGRYKAAGLASGVSVLASLVGILLLSGYGAVGAAVAFIGAATVGTLVSVILLLRRSPA